MQRQLLPRLRTSTPAREHPRTRTRAHARPSDMKHTTVCKHLPTCTQLIKQPSRLLFPVICCDINAVGRSSLYWMDSPVRVGSARPELRRLHIYPTLASHSEVVFFFVLQLPDPNLWSRGCGPTRAAVVKCISAWTPGSAGALSVTHQSYQGERPVGREGEGGFRVHCSILRSIHLETGLPQTVIASKTRKRRIWSFPTITRVEVGVGFIESRRGFIFLCSKSVMQRFSLRAVLKVKHGKHPPLIPREILHF